VSGRFVAEREACRVTVRYVAVIWPAPDGHRQNLAGSRSDGSCRSCALLSSRSQCDPQRPRQSRSRMRRERLARSTNHKRRAERTANAQTAQRLQVLRRLTTMSFGDRLMKLHGHRWIATGEASAVHEPLELCMQLLTGSRVRDERPRAVPEMSCGREPSVCVSARTRTTRAGF